ncbi:MAG TPA: thiol:disulfide interchange protein DsbA/DsbL [Steroidobacteraceae bacterium]|jgi:protein dithiol oxidoreductase (disulfide-forming)|nr:thiol:disulfide interchange protein DsbA/DsbL [Steroidobacteraceae bacterium]
MTRPLTLAVLLALAACARQTPPTTAAAAPAASEAAAPVSAPAAPAPSGQSETEQATASQESGGTDSDHEARSDASLEKIAGASGPTLPAGKWQPGVSYEPLVPAQPTDVAPGKVEVLEFFWLACPHCYALEPELRGWLKTKPGYVEFVRVPIIWQPIHRAHARLYYTLEALGRDDLVAKAFDTIHQDLESRQPPLYGDSDAETFRLQQQFAAQNGVNADAFAKAFNSFSVNASMQHAEEAAQRYQVQGVPLIVVNGKYTTDVGKAGSESRLIELINDLTAVEHAR